MKALIAVSAILASVSCGVTGAEPTLARAVRHTRPNLSSTQAAQIAAACMHWPQGVIRRINVTNWVTPSNRVLPYFDLPDGRAVMISARGTCGHIVSAEVRSDPRAPGLGLTGAVVTGDTVGSAAWIVLVTPPDIAGNWLVIGLAGRVAHHLPDGARSRPGPVHTPVA